MPRLRSKVVFALPSGDGRLQREAEYSRFDGEIQHMGAPKQDPGRPGREQGDRSELLAFLVGVLAGAVIGTVAAVLSDSIDIFAGAIGGVVSGGLVGWWVGGKDRNALSGAVMIPGPTNASCGSIAWSAPFKTAGCAHVFQAKVTRRTIAAPPARSGAPAAVGAI